MAYGDTDLRSTMATAKEAGPSDGSDGGTRGLRLLPA